MATINMSGGTSVSAWEKFPGNLNKVLHNTVDFSKFNGGSGDTIQMIGVPANFLVQSVMHRVLVAEGGTSTGTIGDGTDPNGWIASVDNNAAANTFLLSNEADTSGGMAKAVISGGSAGDLTVTGIATTDTLEGVFQHITGEETQAIITGGAAGDHTVTGIATTDALAGVIQLIPTDSTTATISGGAAGDHTVTGIATTDTIVSVLHYTAGALSADLTAEFTITAADTINNALTSVDLDTNYGMLLCIPDASAHWTIVKLPAAT